MYTYTETAEVKRAYKKQGRELSDQLAENKVFWVEWGNSDSESDAAFSDADIDPDKLFQLQNLYAVADATNMGYLGQRQFKDLLALLDIIADDDQLAVMFEEMDANGDNQITFDEFAISMHNNLDDTQMELAMSLKPGDMGTSSWKRGEIVWSENCGVIICSVGMLIAVFLYFQFILIPLTTAYFFVFLAAPVCNIMEFRPIVCGSKACCNLKDEDGNWKSESRKEAENIDEKGIGQPGAKASLMDCFTMAAIPHGLACLVIIFGAFGLCFLLFLMIYINVKEFSDDPKFQQDIEDYVDNIYKDLNDSGINIILIEKNGYTMDELNVYINLFSGFMNNCVLVLLLFSYLLAEKVDPTVFDPRNQVFFEIENQIQFYIALKTAISMLTGILVAVILLVCQVKLAIMFGLLSFLLNYIPNVGSMIAIVLPIPLVLVDKSLASWQVAGALIGPSIVQGYVGNALEPMVFGKSLNMTPLSILAALVIWGSVWGLMGAVFSVPLLSIQKVCLQHTNHPMAKYIVMMIREDPTIDETAEAGGGPPTTGAPTKPAEDKSSAPTQEQDDEDKGTGSGSDSE